MAYLRTEYPRPQFQRENWLPLNGEWQFAYDDDDSGIKRGLYTGKKDLPLKINVPFSYQYEASGIGDTAVHNTVWYKRNFTADKKNGRAILCFNGCDYITDVWVNGLHAVSHKGAYAPFNADITDLIRTGENTLVVRCFDSLDPTQPRGKQSWTGAHYGCWYIPNTGIWQSVWLEYAGDDYIDGYSLLPDADRCAFYGDIKTKFALADSVEITVGYEGNVVKKTKFSLDGKYTRFTINLMDLNFVDETFLWQPNFPKLFYFTFELYLGNKKVDFAKTRAGLRKISVDSEGTICLNNCKFYQRLILDQGYWKESGITPPSVEAIKKDIELCKAMGFNGARKHQKFEDPYFYYYAEELGFVTWCEMPSAYNFNADEIANVTKEWQEIIAVAKNFTSNICYVPLNESWGTRKIVVDETQQNFARSLYYLTKAADKTKLVSTNDGWENLDVTDILSIHDYSYDSSKFDEMYTPENLSKLYPATRKLIADGNGYFGQPMLLTEFGGIAMKVDAKGESWGYGAGAESEEEFLTRYKNLLKGIYAHRYLQGFCYTQISDVQQEVNGLLTPDRTPKFSLEKIKAITEGKF